MEENYLKDIQLFSGLTNDELKKILQLAFVKEYNEGIALFIEGMAGGVMYVIIDGEVVISKKINGIDTEISRLNDGDYFGELSLIDEDEKRTATAKLARKSELLVITKKCFNQMLETDPSISSKLLMKFLITTAIRLRETTDKLKDTV